MRHAPHRRARPRLRDAVPESGQRLARLCRLDGTELRVSLDIYDGHPFVRLRKWKRFHGGMVPDKGHGLTVRLGEIRPVIEALAQAETLAGPLREAAKATATAEPAPRAPGVAVSGPTATLLPAAEVLPTTPSGRIIPPWEDDPSNPSPKWPEFIDERRQPPEGESRALTLFETGKPKPGGSKRDFGAGL